MNSAEKLIDRLVEVGAKVEAANGRLVVRAGARPVPGELVRLLREAKAEVLATLSPGWWRRQFVVRTIDRGSPGTSWNADGTCSVASGYPIGSARAAANLSVGSRP